MRHRIVAAASLIIVAVAGVAVGQVLTPQQQAIQHIDNAISELEAARALLSTTTTTASTTTTEPQTTTTLPPPTTTTLPPTTTTTTLPPTTTTLPPTTTTTQPPSSVNLVYTQDTTITDTIRLRPGDSIELRNGAQLIFTDGATLDAQGSDVWTWTWNGTDPESAVYNPDRDINIYGDGSIMFMAGSTPATIRNVHIDLRPDQEIGHYPLHWHLAGDDTRGTLVENVLVTGSTNLAFVPHGSHGITFRDVVAIDTTGDALWWDEPGTSEPCRFLKFCTVDNSNDITVERLYVNGVSNWRDDHRGFRLSGVTLGAGSNNSITDSLVVGVEPSHVKDCSAYHWPEGANQNDGGNVWLFENNHGDSSCHGIFVWQNDSNLHVIDGFTGGGIDHGAYGNNYLYRNVNVPYLEVHAVGFRVEDSNIGDVILRDHQFDGRVEMRRVVVDRVIVDDGGLRPIVLSFTDSDVSCDDVTVLSSAGSTVVIDGVECG